MCGADLTIVGPTIRPQAVRPQLNPGAGSPAAVNPEGVNSGSAPGGPGSGTAAFGGRPSQAPNPGPAPVGPQGYPPQDYPPRDYPPRDYDSAPAGYAAQQDSSQLRYLSEKFVAQMRDAGVVITYDRESVAKVADQIDADRVGVTREEAERWANFTGAYLGECLLRNYGGEWRYDEKKGVWATVIGRHETAFYPIEKALGHITVGRGGSILKFFDSVKNRLEQMEARESGRRPNAPPTLFERLKVLFTRPKEQ